MVKKNSIPERWRSLTAIGTRVPGSRFIAFKVPLKGATNQRVTQNQKFTPKDLVTNIRNQNEELGLILDLTNTERYYTTKDLPRSVQYMKLHTAGLKIPDDATVHQFKRLVRQFLFANEDNDKLIGVHCTTGINRTGYLICRYLIDVDGWRPLQALTAFANSRGHPIEGAVYIEDLIKGPMRSNVGIDLPPTEEEKKALNSGSEDQTRDEQGNEFGDFDARERRHLPLLRSDEFLDDFDARERMVAPRNILGDHDLRLPSHEPQDRPYMDDMAEPLYPERLRRPGDFQLDLESFHDPSPRPLMSIPPLIPREMQRRFEDPGMLHEGMDFDLRARGHPMHAMQPHDLSSDMQYEDPSSHPVPMFARNTINNPGFEDEAEPQI
ncbi:PREDICTED: mRNA-capping enzyme-like [Nanorana parkeri]|uniref:mRNA-capping enzyme-like n=1 Tax=Nanorana parkeri TaxID=125878 RepID=UPI000854F306|nr:PREDICTED: mRNA-capping enzyme-like [Nanorana parkeri]